MSTRRPLLFALVLLSLPTAALAAPVTAAYLHCGARQRTTLSGAQEAVGLIGRVDALVLAGIEPAWAASLQSAYAASAEGEVGAVLGATGGDSERLLLLWDSARLALRDDEVERGEYQAAGAPAPLIARMTDRSSGVDFVLAAVSLEDTKSDGRALAAIRLVEFAEDEPEPIVLLANLDRGIRLDGTERDGSLGLLTDARIYEWRRPKPLKRTDCNLGYKSGVREFVLLAGEAKEWESEVANGASVDEWCGRFSGKCCWEPPRCRDCGPWHLPVVARFTPASAPSLPPLRAPAPSRPGLSEKQQILERIDWLVGELESLRQRVERLEGAR